MVSTPLRRLALSLVALPLLASACGDDDGAEATPGSTTTTTVLVVLDEPTTTTEVPSTTAAPTTTEAPQVLTILVTNDDGIAAPGLDALVGALLELPNVELTVVGPADDRSGTGGSVTEGEVVVTDTTTASGHEALAVTGFPADTVEWALTNLDAEFDLVVSGTNSGQNFGPFHLISGTVGAARYAAQSGLPAVAVSTGIDPATSGFDHRSAVAAAVEWIEAHRADYEAGAVSLWSINAPSCADGGRGLLEVPLADDFGDRDVTAYDCASTATDPVDDVDAYLSGFAAVTELPIAVEG